MVGSRENDDLPIGADAVDLSVGRHGRGAKECSHFEGSLPNDLARFWMEAGEDLSTASQKEESIPVVNGGGNIGGGMVEGPGQSWGFPAQFQGVERILLRGTQIDEGVADHGRGHGPEVFPPFRIEPTPAPPLGPGKGVVCREIVAAKNEDESLLILPQGKRRRVGLARLGPGICLSRCFPEVSARFRIDTEEVTVVAMQDLHVEPSPVEERTAGVTPVDPEGPVLLLKIPVPDGLSREVESHQIARAKEKNSLLSIGDGRRLGHEILAAVALVQFSVGDGDVPEDSAGVPVQGESGDLGGAAIEGREKNEVPNNGRRGRTGTRQRGFPNDVLARTPIHRQVRFVRRAIEIGPSKLWPVSRRQGDGKDCGDADDKKRSLHKSGHDLSLAAPSENTIT